MLARILIGAVVTGLGLILVLKTEWILDFFGSVEWAERNAGGSRMFYRLLGALVSILGFLVITNLWQPFLEATLGSLISTGR